jgi:hypothetical protein
MRGGALAGGVVLLALVSGCQPADGTAAVYDDGSVYVPGSYTVRESGVRLRTGSSACHEAPGSGNCGVLAGLEPGDHLYPICQRKGQLVGRNSWWVYVDAPSGDTGWVASWYLTCPTNRLPEVDDCTAAQLD